MKYMPSQGTAGSTSISDAWTLGGRTQADFAYAQACAASFVIAYESFSSAAIKTLETATTMLTDGAKGRFYGTAPNPHPDQHMDPMWRASLQKHQYQQGAQSAAPALLTSSYLNGRLLIWMLVPYQTSIQIDNSTPALQNAQMTVLLMAVPKNTQQAGTGWQVSQWVEGSAQFNPPNPL
jgi:hypothetical protein